MKYPLITAHSGCMNTKPNTMESILAGLKSGADIVEVDVRATKDGVAVLIHDDSISLQENIIRIEDVDYERLKRHNPEIVRLDEVLVQVREYNRIFNLDLKDDAVVDPMIRTVKNTGMTDYVVLSGCGREKAAYIKENHRGFQVLLNADEDWLLSKNADYGTFITMTCSDAVSVACCGININYEACREAFMEYACKRCLPVYLYTLDEAGLMKKYMNMGAYSITTNRVDLLQKVKNGGFIL